MRVIRIFLSLFILTVLASYALAQPQATVKKTLVIGIDGCRPDAMLAANAPYLHA